MIRRTAAAAALLVLTASVLTGCWNRRELNELAIAAAIGIDKSGDQYEFTVQIVNPGETGMQKESGARSSVVTFTSKGQTLLEAARRMTTESPRRIYGAHLRIVIIGESAAREGIGGVLDVLSREQEIRTDFYIAVARKGTAKELLGIYTMLEKIPANQLFTSLEMSGKSWAATGKVSLDELVADVLHTGKEPVLTGIVVNGDPAAGQSRANTQRTRPLTVLRYSGMAAFHRDKLVGWLDEAESKGYNYVMGRVHNTIVTVTCPDGGKTGVELLRTRAELKAKTAGGEPSIAVKLIAEANVTEVQCAIDMTKPAVIRELELLTEADIESKMRAAVDKAQHVFHCDIFGFGDAIHRKSPALWKELEKQWQAAFVSLPVSVDVDVRIRRTGTVTQSILEELKELGP